MLLDKKNALYVKGCIIPNGVTDSQGDTLNTEEIKRIFTSFNNQDNFEVYHEDEAIPEVSLLENYISTADEALGTSIVPSGSWNCVIRVDNPDIQESLLTGEFRGLSLSNRIAKPCRKNLHGTVRYKDVGDAECIIPRFISFVEKGANGYALHVMDYDAYVLKSGGVVVEETNGGERMAFDLIGGLKSLIQQAEASEEEEPTVEKEDDAQVEEVAEVKDETTEEVVEDEATEKEEDPVVEKEDKPTDDETTEDEESDEEAVIEKEDNPESDEPAEETDEEEGEVDELEAKITAIVEKVLAEKLAQPTVPEDEPAEEPEPEEEVVEDEDTPKITKSEKVVITEETHVEQRNYFQMTGRDPLTGKKIRN